MRGSQEGPGKACSRADLGHPSRTPAKYLVLQYISEDQPTPLINYRSLDFVCTQAGVPRDILVMRVKSI